MRRRNFSFGQRLLPVAIIVGLVFGMLANGTAANYYKGQAITMLVPTTAGGGGDIWARFISNNLGRFIPGNPTVVIRNNSTAGGLIAGNMAWHAKPDGKTLLFCTGRIIMMNILKQKGMEYELEKMHPLYASPAGGVYYFKPGLVPEPKDIVKTKGLIWVHGAATGGSSTFWIFAKAVLGFESKDVLGYGGSGPAKLAFMTGEGNCTGAGSDSMATSWKGDLERGAAVALFQSGLLDPDGNVIKDPSIPPIPTTKDIYEQIYGKLPSGPAWDAYKLLLGSRAYDNSVVMPPTTKPEYVKIVRKAFEDMAKNPEFLKEGEFLAKGATHIVGEPLVRGFAKGVSGKPGTVEFMRKHLTEKYGVQFE